MGAALIDSDRIGTCDECKNKKNIKDSQLFKPNIIVQSFSISFCSRGHFWLNCMEGQSKNIIEPSTSKEQQTEEIKGKLIDMKGEEE